MLFAGVINVANSVPAVAPPLKVIAVCVPVSGISNNAYGVAGGAGAVVGPSKNNTNPDDVPEVPVAPVAPVTP
jgi:hypothetical protein